MFRLFIWEVSLEVRWESKENTGEYKSLFNTAVGGWDLLAADRMLTSLTAQGKNGRSICSYQPPLAEGSPPVLNPLQVPHEHV